MAAPISGMINRAGRIWLKIRRFRRERNMMTPPGSLRDKLIAHTPDGEDSFRTARVSLQLFPQPADMNVDHLRLADELRTPYLCQQFLCRKDFFRLCG